MDNTILLLGRMQSPFNAHILHMNSVDALAMHVFLRQLRALPDQDCHQVVLMADVGLSARPNQLRVLGKAIALSRFEVAGIAGPMAAQWSEALGVPRINDSVNKPKVTLDAVAVKARNQFLSKNQHVTVKPDVQVAVTPPVASLTTVTSDSKKDELALLEQVVSQAMARVEQVAANDPRLKAITQEPEPVVTTALSESVEHETVVADATETVQELETDQPTLELTENLETPTSQTEFVFEQSETLEENSEDQELHAAENIECVIPFSDEPEQIGFVFPEPAVVEAHEHIEVQEHIERASAPQHDVDLLVDPNLLNAIPSGETIGGQELVREEAEEEEAVAPILDVIAAQEQEPTSEEPVFQDELHTSWELAPIEETPKPERVYKDAFEEDFWNTEGSVATLEKSEQSPVREMSGNSQPQIVVIEAVAPLRHAGKLRSGQLIMHAGDVIVENSVNSGAEIVATGDIHVYGGAGGRLLAGAQGNKNARIYVQSFDAELIAIAGRYHLFEEVPENWVGKPLKISLVNNELHFESIVAMPRISTPQAA